MRKITFLIMFLSNSYLFCQDKILVEGDLGTAIPMHQNLKNVFDLGLDINVGFAINILSENIFLKPSGGVKWYFKQIEDVNSVTEHLRTWKAGLELRYYCLKKGKWKLAPYINVNHNWSSNYYSESHRNPFTNQTSGATSDKYLKGSGLSFAVGSMLNYESIYLKINYEIFNPTLIVNQSIVDAAYGQGIIVEPKQTLNLSSLNITFGYTFKLK